MPYIHRLQPALCPVMDVYLPGSSLWPEVRPLLRQEHDLQVLEELCSSLTLMDELQHDIPEQTGPFPGSVALQPASYQVDQEGGLFSLTLDARGFSPDEVTVRRLGRKLMVSGTTQEKREDGKGWSSYRLQQFSQEFDLPEGLNPDAISCCMSPDGTLRIQAAPVPQAEEVQEELTIRWSPEEEPQQSVCAQAEASSTETDSDTQDLLLLMDWWACYL